MTREDIINALNSRKSEEEEILIEKEDLSFSHLSGIKLVNVVFRDCNLTGAVFDDSFLRHVGFYGCGLNKASFRKTRMYYVFINRCTLNGCSFHAASVDNCDFSRSDMTNCNIIGGFIWSLKITSTDIISFQIGKCRGFYHEGYVNIHGKVHSINKWLNEMESLAEIGTDTPWGTIKQSDIDLYKGILTSIKESGR